MSDYAVILAAGASERMGTPKGLLELDGSSLLQRTIAVARGASAKPLVVLGANARAVSRESGDARTVTNDRWRDGMSTSIACGIDALPEQTRRAVILTIDQPDVDSTLVRALLDACGPDFDASASRYGDGRLGVPACFSSTLFDVLKKLTGDQGARRLLRSERYDIATVEAADKTADVDTPEDWERYVDAHRDGERP